MFSKHAKATFRSWSLLHPIFIRKPPHFTIQQTFFWLIWVLCSKGVVLMYLNKSCERKEVAAETCHIYSIQQHGGCRKALPRKTIISHYCTVVLTIHSWANLCCSAVDISRNKDSWTHWLSRPEMRWPYRESRTIMKVQTCTFSIFFCATIPTWQFEFFHLQRYKSKGASHPCANR